MSNPTTGTQPLAQAGCATLHFDESGKPVACPGYPHPDLPTCPDCHVPAGHAHDYGCDVPTCPVSGVQRLMCDGHGEQSCPEVFWTGFWPKLPREQDPLAAARAVLAADQQNRMSAALAEIQQVLDKYGVNLGATVQLTPR